MVGSVCGLTDKKPEFNKTCFKIEFEDTIEDRIQEVNTRLVQEESKRFWIYGYFSIMVLGGLALFALAYFLVNHVALMNDELNGRGQIVWILPVISFAIGVKILGLGVGTLRTHLIEMGDRNEKKKRLDQVLYLYNIEYNLKIKLGKKYHGTQDVYVDLDLKKPLR